MARNRSVAQTSRLTPALAICTPKTSVSNRRTQCISRTLPNAPEGAACLLVCTCTIQSAAPIRKRTPAAVSYIPRTVAWGRTGRLSQSSILGSAIKHLAISSAAWSTSQFAETIPSPTLISATWTLRTLVMDPILRVSKCHTKTSVNGQGFKSSKRSMSCEKKHK